MKKFMNNMVKKAENMGVKAMCKVSEAKVILANKSGEAYLDLVIKILLCVVLGALLLAGLYALFGDLVMPTLTTAQQFSTIHRTNSAAANAISVPLACHYGTVKFWTACHSGAPGMPFD